MSATLKLLAPLSGPIVALEDVPDPVFSGKLVGDGLSIDPVSARLLSPCDGTVVALHASSHAVTIRTAEGVDVLLHVGVDTVKLRGQGFTPRVSLGQAVRARDLLLDFDADAVALAAPSLLTQVVLVTPEKIASIRKASGEVRAGEDVLLEVQLVSTAREAPGTSGQADRGTTASAEKWSEPIRLPNPQGLHARPAAVLAAAARSFQSRVALEKDGRRADARSVVSLMALETNAFDQVRLVASGPDAEAALRELEALIRTGLGEQVEAEVVSPEHPAAGKSETTSQAPGGPLPSEVSGVPAAPGLALGQTRQWRRATSPVIERASRPAAEEQQALAKALSLARIQLEELSSSLAREGDQSHAAIFSAHAELLDDPELREQAESAVASGSSAAFAWSGSCEAQASRLACLKQPLLASRATDVRDVGMRVLALLPGEVASSPSAAWPEDTILIADELTPSELVLLDRSRVRGVAMSGGGATSHVAILARSLRLPVVVGLGPRIASLVDGTRVVLDGSRGLLRSSPDPAELARLQAAIGRAEQRRRTEAQSAQQPAVTLDGLRVALRANVARPEEVAQASALGAEGVGLFRTELLFADRLKPPSEDEQAAAYESALRACPGQPVVVRLLDLGGDKPLAWLPLPREANPFLGERGIRLLLARPEVLRRQARALLRASSAGHLEVMLPMVSSASELRETRRIFEAEARALGLKLPALGAMVEVPSAALNAEALAVESEFFSLGTNDLSQYTLAMDRGHPRLASRVDGLDPSVLRLVQWTCEAGRRHGRPVAVCGGLASDPQAVPLLLGLGVRELSVSWPEAPAIKALIRRLRLSDCEALAARALQAEDARAVRELVPVEEA